MKFLSKVKLSNRRYKTPEGYLVCVDSIIARTGKQEYLKSEVFQDSNDDSIIQIDRPKSEVLSPSTIASFENKPLVDEHPDEDVNVDNYRDYAIGFARDVRGSKLDDVDILIANLIFTDPEAIAEIESGEKTELSCGYDCDILGEGDNLYQANIRGNHIALCKAGRAGIARIQDSSSKETQEVVDSINDVNIKNRKTRLLKIFKKYNYNRDDAIAEVNNIKGITEDEIAELVDWITDIYKDFNSLKDSGYSEKLKDLSPEERSKKIDELIADEIEAIDGYKEAMKYADEADKSIYSTIIAEELKHIIELKALKNEKFKDTSASTTRRMFKESEVGDENSWFGTTEWGTPKGNMYIYKKGNKIIAEGSSSSYYGNTLEKGDKKVFNSVKELNKWLNTFTEDSNIKDIDFKYLTEEAKKLKEELNLYKRQIGSHKSTNEREYSPRQNQKNNEYVKELNESINQAIKFLSEGNYNKQAWIRLALNLESWKGEPELENICKKAENAIKKFTKYINEKNNMLNVDTYEKVTKEKENKKMRDGALRGIHLKKIRNTLRNEDEDLVEDFLDYMDTRPDLVKEYDDYSDYMVREDFETWKKYKKIKTRDVDTYEEVTEDLEKELKDSDTLKNLAYKFAQMGNYFDRANSANSRKILGKEDDEKIAEFYKLGLQVYKQLEQEVDYLKNNKEPLKSSLSFWRDNETVNLLVDGAERLIWIPDRKCEALGNKIRNLIKDYKKYNYKDSKVKDSKKYTITFWVRLPGNTTYKDTLEINYLEEFDKYLDKYGIGTDYAFIDSVTSKNGLDFDGHLRKWTDVRKELYRRVLRLDSKVKDKLENKPINILIKFDSSKEANDALKSLQRKEKFMNSKLVANDTIKVITTDVDYEELKNMLKLYFIKNIKTIDSKVNNSEKLLNIIKLYKKVTKDSKLKDSYVEEWWGQTNEEPKLFAKQYGLTVVALKRNMDETLYRFYGPTKNIEKAMKDGYFYNPERYVKDEKKIIKKASDSKLKDVNYEKIVEKVLDENEIYLDDVDYVEDTNRGVEILCTSYYAQLKVKRILEKAFGRVKSANYRTIILAHEDIK